VLAEPPEGQPGESGQALGLSLRPGQPPKMAAYRFFVVFEIPGVELDVIF
jgi:hypothetical protein